MNSILVHCMEPLATDVFVKKKQKFYCIWCSAKTRGQPCNAANLDLRVKLGKTRRSHKSARSVWKTFVVFWKLLKNASYTPLEYILYAGQSVQQRPPSSERSTFGLIALTLVRIINHSCPSTVNDRLSSSHLPPTAPIATPRSFRSHVCPINRHSGCVTAYTVLAINTFVRVQWRV